MILIPITVLGTSLGQKFASSEVCALSTRHCSLPRENNIITEDNSYFSAFFGYFIIISSLISL